MFLKNVKLQFLAVLGLGALLGYAAAYGKLNPFQKADAGPADQPKTAASSAPAAPGCCSDGLSKAGMLALATHNETVTRKAAVEGKKPNILFIMGDDIGMWNIGAYHRGLMAGRTPNLDKMAKEGMIFTDYYAEASCTAGRANFITGELPIRTGMTTVGQAGAKTGSAGGSLHHRHRAQGSGLRHRPVRQEPPRRPQRVSAHRPRLRRVLRLPVSPGRDGRSGAS